MKNAIRRITPEWAYLFYRKIKLISFNKRSPNEVFKEIYKTNKWKSSESISGTGSEIIQTKLLMKELEKLFNELKIKSVLDIPCGDFNWMQHVDLSKVDYTGADIVEDLIKINSEKYKERTNVNFKTLNLINDALPKCDIIIVRDCFVHLSYADIFKAIKNIKLSGCKYLLTTTHTNFNTNFDILTGDFRRINLQKKPFSFPEPILIINENSTEENSKDKSMALWNLSNI
jgi:2-polyprenyl-3-methyl-5-hydroxy-6-metoxy-1,4-benzoquinol methylase